MPLALDSSMVVCRGMSKVEVHSNRECMPGPARSGEEVLRVNEATPE